MEQQNDHILKRFRDVYDALDASHLESLDTLYTSDVVFEDPFHRLEGLAALRPYFSNLYAHVDICRFEWGIGCSGDGKAFQEWTLVLKHRTFRPSETLRLPGCSSLRIRQDLVQHHRDYFDAGAMIYERVPILGAVIRAIKRQVGQS